MPKPGQSHRFNRAISRLPAKSCVDGLRIVDAGPPDYELFLEQHKSYIAALERAGVSVTLLPAEEQFPDSVFVEDTALCLPEGAVRLSPGAASRAGEAPAIEPALQEAFDVVTTLSGIGTVDGGDILTTETEIIVGLSERTSREGAEELQRIAADWGQTIRIAETPDGVLHFKSDCAILDGDTILATRRLANSGVFSNYKILHTPAGEEAAANTVRVNDVVFLAAGHPATADMLNKLGYELIVLDISEAAKLDGGLSCMSLRF